MLVQREVGRGAGLFCCIALHASVPLVEMGLIGEKHCVSRGVVQAASQPGGQGRGSWARKGEEGQPAQAALSPSRARMRSRLGFIVRAIRTD